MKNAAIRIINSNFELLGEIDDYESLIFIRRFYKVGEFELHININKQNVDKLQEDNLIILGMDTKKVGVIRHKEIQLNEQGEATETLLVKGYTLKGILGRRIIIPPVGQGYDNAEGSIESIMKQFINNNVVNPVDLARIIPQVVIAPNRNRGKEDKWRGRFEKLPDKLQEIGEYSEIGWDIWLDTDNYKWIFDVIEGRNLTANQEVLPPVILSVDFDNIKGQTYVDSSLSYSNVGYAGGKGEEEERLIQQIGESTGFDRIESFLDCSNAEDIDQLTQEGNKKLSELKKIETFESQIIDFGSFIYGKDWDLGDIVTAQNRKWNLTLDARIVEVKEIYEASGLSLEATFGNNIPTILDEIKKIKKQQPLIEKSSGVGTITWDNVENKPTIPTKTTELQNDAGFITVNDVPQPSTYTHNQLSSANEWIIVHSLNKYPNITVVDSGGSVVIGDIKYVSENEVRLNFNAPFSGKAYLN